MDDIQSWEAHYDPNGEWQCKCSDCYPQDEELFDTDYWETDSE